RYLARGGLTADDLRLFSGRGDAAALSRAHRGLRDRCLSDRRGVGFEVGSEPSPAGSLSSGFLSGHWAVVLGSVRIPQPLAVAACRVDRPIRLRVVQEATTGSTIIYRSDGSTSVATAMALGEAFPIMPATLPLTAAH